MHHPPQPCSKLRGVHHPPPALLVSSSSTKQHPLPPNARCHHPSPTCTLSKGGGVHHPPPAAPLPAMAIQGGGGAPPPPSYSSYGEGCTTPTSTPSRKHISCTLVGKWQQGSNPKKARLQDKMLGGPTN